MRSPALALLIALAAAPVALAAPSAPSSRQVVASGTVPDEATRAAVISRLNELYDDAEIVDRIEVGGVIAPPNWDQYVLRMLSPEIKRVSGGELDIQGNDIRLSGEVVNEVQRQNVASELLKGLNPTYTLTNRLAVGTGKQDLLDQALAGRIVEFQSGSASLTPAGRAVLDEVLTALRQIGDSRVEVAGHTDALGERQSNINLSLARASAVKAYLVSQGVSEANLSVMGYGPDRPIADNDTDDGRARNRRIEFKILQ